MVTIITISILTISTSVSIITSLALLESRPICVCEREESHAFVLFIPCVTYGLSSKHLAGNRTGIKTVFCPLGPGNPGMKTNGLGAPEFCQGLCL